jgi:hypothetical protein
LHKPKEEQQARDQHKGPQFFVPHTISSSKFLSNYNPDFLQVQKISAIFFAHHLNKMLDKAIRG